MSDRLAVIVPTRGRPENIRKVISAWDFTNAWDVADLVLGVDADDPGYSGYVALFDEFVQGVPDGTASPLLMVTVGAWIPMVHKLDRVAQGVALSGRYFALGFAGDDHLPRTINWAKTYLAALRELGSGMVYSDDGYQGENLSTEWAMTTDIVRAWGRMVPAPVEHMYCDQALLELLTDVGAVRYLPHVQIEHMHPFAKKADSDDQYRRVNASDQFARDKAGYLAWTSSSLRHEQAEAVKLLRRGRSEERPRTVAKKTQRREAARMSRRSPFPQFFRQVKNVTPEEIGLSLADLASQVPGHQAIVELGVYHGASALRLAWGARQGGHAHTWAVDPWESEGNIYGDTMGDLGSARRWARHWVTSLGYSNDITLIQRFSHEVAADWSEGQPRVGLLFVDGDHTAEGARRDIEAWSPHLADGAIIAVDDYVNENYPGVREAVDALVAEGILTAPDVYHDRMAVTRLAGKVEGGASGQESRVTAITSEGVAIDHPGTALTVGTEPEGLDVSLSSEPVLSEPEPDRSRVTLDEATTVQVAPGTAVTDLTLPQLRALAKARSITLGVRKDKKAETIQAILDGR